MLSNPLYDEDRFRGYIEQAIKDGEVEAYDAYTKETRKQRDQRQAKARRDEKEAKEHAKKLGMYDSIFGDGDGKPNKKCSKKKECPDLAELIQQKQKGRADAFLDDLEARYAAPKKGNTKSQHGKKRKVEDPPEELFQRNRQKMRKAERPETTYDEDEEEIDLENDTPRSHDEDDDEDEDDIKPAKTKKRAAVRGAKAMKKKKGTAQKK